MSPMDTAIYWTEYVARHPNYSFKPPTVDLPYYQFLNLDILAVFVIFFLVSYYITKSIFSLLCGKKNDKSTVDKNKRKSKKAD